MKQRRQTLLLSVLLVTSTLPMLAQVEKVAMLTTGISCGVCAAVSEVHLKRMAGVDRVAISLAKEEIVIYYKPGAAFSTQRIRDVLQGLDVGVVQVQIRARGYVQERGGKRFFIAGKDKFGLVPVGDAPIPRDTPLLIEAILSDNVDPIQLKMLSFKPLAQ
jgi:copper chaperone CopZ